MVELTELYRLIVSNYITATTTKHMDNYEQQRTREQQTVSTRAPLLVLQHRAYLSANDHEMVKTGFERVNNRVWEEKEVGEGEGARSTHE